MYCSSFIRDFRKAIIVHITLICKHPSQVIVALLVQRLHFSPLNTVAFSITQTTETDKDLLNELSTNQRIQGYTVKSTELHTVCVSQILNYKIQKKMFFH